MVLFHGSKNIIVKPVYGAGNPMNDYGLGLYCTENIELAKEWACTENRNGYANQYELDVEGLAVCRLLEPEYHILNWLAVLLRNREFATSTRLSREAKEYILSTFLPDLDGYDVIIGYRADDSYFRFAKSFLNGSISLQQLSRAMKLGNLGEQVVLVSEKAFSHLTFSRYEEADGSIYWGKRETRDSAARKQFDMMVDSASVSDGIYILDILREKWNNDEPRLR